MRTTDSKTDLLPLFEQLPDPVVLVDMSDRVVGANAAARELYIEAPATRLRDRRGVLRSFSLHPIPLAKDRAAIVMKDVTKVQQLDAELALLRRADSAGFMTTSLVHDLNDLLTPVVCLTALLAARLDHGSRVGQLAHEAAKVAEAAGRLTRRVLANVRQGTPDDLVDVSRAVGQLREVLTRIVGDGVALEFDLDGQSGSSHVDRVLLERALLNLISNARDAVRRGGRVCITTHPAEFNADDARRYACPGPGSYVVTTVTDDGVGLSAEARERIFDGLYSSKRYAGGVGFGLMNSYRFARQSGGGLTLESGPDGLTRATLCLPRSGPPQPASRPAKVENGHETVLVVERDEHLCEVMCLILEEEGYRVAAANHATGALELLSRPGLRPDLALVDAVMPGLDGRCFASAISASGLATRVALVAGDEEGVLRHHGIDPQSPDVIHKPFTPDQLVQRVRTWLDGQGAAA